MGNNAVLTTLLEQDEILIKDEQGRFRIFKNNEMLPINELEKRTKQKDNDVDRMPLKPEPIEQDVKNGAKEIFSNAAKAFIEEKNIQFENEQKKQAFTNYITTYLRDLRNKKEMMYLLTRPKESQGLGVSNSAAVEILNSLDKKKLSLNMDYATVVDKAKKVEFVEKQPETKKTFVEPKPVQPEVKKQTEPAEKPEKPMFIPQKFDKPKFEEQLEQQAKPEQDKKQELKKIAMAEEARVAPVIIQPKQPEKKPEIQVVKEIEKTKPVKFQKKVSSTTKEKRPMVQDIKFTPMEGGLVGPVQEIQRINLVDFRRMDPRFKEIVIEKIEILGETSFGDKIKGIVAWKHSPVNRIYLLMSLKALQTGKTIDDIIIEWQRQNQPVLTRTEFEEINIFNKALSF